MSDALRPFPVFSPPITGLPEVTESVFTTVLSEDNQLRLESIGEESFNYRYLRPQDTPTSYQPGQYILPQESAFTKPAKHFILFKDSLSLRSPRGVSMTECLHPSTLRLDGKREPVESIRNHQFIMLQIFWPGCTPWARVLQVNNDEGSVVDRCKLAAMVAASFRDMFMEDAVPPRRDGSPARLTGLRFEQLHLVKLSSLDGVNWEAEVNVLTRAWI
ncbi:hypothetical protein BKA93DRAFT_790548 [Sparassis latifolia]